MLHQFGVEWKPVQCAKTSQRPQDVIDIEGRAIKVGVTPGLKPLGEPL